MSEHPILLNTEMVRAILNGKKTQTRRVIKPQPLGKPTGIKVYGSIPKWRARYGYQVATGFDYEWNCPYGQVGDKLYVREAYRVCNMDIYRDQALMIHYYSDRVYKSVVVTNAEMKLWKARKKPFMKTPGRFMYKSLARIWLEITNIRVERVQDISETDALSEGVITGSSAMGHTFAAKEHFMGLWRSINDKRGFGGEVNPWCWCISFKKIEK